MKKLIGIFDIKKMTPEQIYEKVKEQLDSNNTKQVKKLSEESYKSKKS